MHDSFAQDGSLESASEICSFPCLCFARARSCTSTPGFEESGSVGYLRLDVCSLGRPFGALVDPDVVFVVRLGYNVYSETYFCVRRILAST